jgi:hypothetical protein
VFYITPSEKIPEDLREMYGHLSSLAFEIDGHLIELSYLYGSEPRVKFLDQLAGMFFMRHQRALIHQTIALLAQLTEHLTSSGRKDRQENLNILRLHNTVDPKQYPKLRRELQQLWKEIDLVAGPVRTYRNEVTSHYCLARLTPLSPSTKFGNDITLGSLGTVHEKIQDFLDAFDIFFTGAEAPRYHTDGGEADELIRRFERLG